MQGHRYIYPALSVPLFLSVVISGSVGLFTSDFYAQETQNWQLQSRGQDMIDVFLVAPVLLVSAIRAAFQKKVSLLVWGGVNMYFLYTYLIFCFSVHFNSMFLLYCLNLGLSFYSTLHFLKIVSGKNVFHIPSEGYPRRITGIYFLILSVVFSGLWLMEIIPSVFDHKSPSVLEETGLVTNPVHVIDLSILLPAVCITGIGLLKKRYFSYWLGPGFLVFFILMDITIGFLSLLLQQGKPGTDFVILSVMCILAVFSFVLLSGYYGNIRRTESAIRKQFNSLQSDLTS